MFSLTSVFILVFHDLLVIAKVIAYELLPYFLPF